ncbi:baseplate J/gp47 family protein [Cupriavidus pauculus]|uniref:Phage baseplate protein n=1 Tax=Cupriavidus pauculus TaxID=82633 RepID=A0A2N5C435_9BURK|nr:baseplate J/gp47 family protein [Cupriavidus pauculus]PLP96977.1 phage baseplate protein [Cupriavidus pauculus]
MPYARPTLSELRANVAADQASELEGSDPLLRFANLRILGVGQAGLTHLQYGYLDWIARQSVPYTAEDEYLEAWGALKGVYRKDATSADGFATFGGTAGEIPAGWGLVRSDGVKYTVSASASIGGGGSVQVEAMANDTGAAANCALGTQFSLASPIPGIQSNGSASSPFTGGADVEENDAYRARVLEAYQESPAGGNEADYIRWAKGVAGVTRAWVARNGFGAGTVVVYVMLDLANAESGGFPIGTDGVATAETRSAVKATGDQLRVANALYSLQPVTALMYAVAPIRDNINFTITGYSGASAATKKSISDAISDVFFRNGAPGGTVNLSDIESAIWAVPGTAGFVITLPTGNITSATGHLPVLGTVT